MIPASYLFKTIYRDAWGIDLTATEESHVETARRGRLRGAAGAALSLGRWIARAGVTLATPRSRKLQCAACHG